MIDLVYCLKNLLFFDIPLLYYHINLRSSITFSLSSEDIHASLGIYLSCLFVIVSESFCREVLDAFVILLAVLLPIKLQIAPATFPTTSFEVF